MRLRTVVVKFLVRKRFNFSYYTLRPAANTNKLQFCIFGAKNAAAHLKKLQCQPASSNFVKRSRSIMDRT